MAFKNKQSRYQGTTTLAFFFKDSVMVAADSQDSMGSYISSQYLKKTVETNPYILGTMAGGAADYQFWHRNLGIKDSYIIPKPSVAKSNASCFPGVAIVSAVYGRVAFYLSSSTKRLYKTCGRLDDQIALLSTSCSSFNKAWPSMKNTPKLPNLKGRNFKSLWNKKQM